MGGGYPELFWGFAFFFLAPFAAVLAYLSFRAGSSSIPISLRLLQMSGALFIFILAVFMGFRYSAMGPRLVAYMIALLPPVLYSVGIDRFLNRRQATIVATAMTVIGFLVTLILFLGNQASDYILTAIGIWIFYRAAKSLHAKRNAN
jgi:hypothetical protein